MTLHVQSTTPVRPFERWSLTGLLSIVLLLASALAFLASGGGTDGVRAVVRLTARTSLILFLAAFAASSLVRLWPSVASRWLMRNRRYVGLGFAVSHLIHAIALVVLWRTAPDLFWQLTNPANVASGGSTYAIIALMAATSFDGAARAIGLAAWRALHWVGMHAIFVSFLISNGKRIPASGWYGMPVALLTAVLGLRLLAWWRARRPARRA